MQSLKTIRRRVLGASLVAVVAGGGALVSAQADWSSTRQREFAAWQKAHPGPERQGAGSELWDHPLAPRLVVIPAGSFTMGSPASEVGRVANEGPQQQVTIDAPIAVGKYPVTRDEYAAFIAETKRPDGATCSVPGNTWFTLGGGFNQAVGPTWRNPGIEQTGSDPVVCVSWRDAQAYADWLAKKTGKAYRLLSEAEWEYAARAGTTTARYWGEAASHDAANYGAEPVGGITAGEANGADRWVYTSPVGSFPPNAFGLYDMLGNVSQWVADCFRPTYNAPLVTSATCAHLARGAAWAHRAAFVRAAYRYAAPNAQNRSSLTGFRVARSL